MTMAPAERKALKSSLNDLVDECEDHVEWIGELRAELGDDMWGEFNDQLDHLYKSLKDAAYIAIRLRFAAAEHYAHYGNMKEEQ